MTPAEERARVEALAARRSSRMSRADFRLLLRHVQRIAKCGSLLQAIRLLWHASGCGLIAAKHAAERLKSIPDLSK